MSKIVGSINTIFSVLNSIKYTIYCMRDPNYVMQIMATGKAFGMMHGKEVKYMWPNGNNSRSTTFKNTKPFKCHFGTNTPLTSTISYAMPYPALRVCDWEIFGQAVFFHFSSLSPDQHLSWKWCHNDIVMMQQYGFVIKITKKCHIEWRFSFFCQHMWGVPENSFSIFLSFIAFFNSLGRLSEVIFLLQISFFVIFPKRRWNVVCYVTWHTFLKTSWQTAHPTKINTYNAIKYLRIDNPKKLVLLISSIN